MRFFLRKHVHGLRRLVRTRQFIFSALPCAAPWRLHPKRSSPVTPGVLFSRMYFGAVHVHGSPSFACMRGWLGAKYSGQETICFLSSALVQPPGGSPQSDRAPSRPACCFLGCFLTPCCRPAWQALSAVRGQPGVQNSGRGDRLDGEVPGQAWRRPEPK